MGTNVAKAKHGHFEHLREQAVLSCKALHEHSVTFKASKAMISLSAECFALKITVYIPVNTPLSAKPLLLKNKNR